MKKKNHSLSFKNYENPCTESKHQPFCQAHLRSVWSRENSLKVGGLGLTGMRHLQYFFRLSNNMNDVNMTAC